MGCDIHLYVEQRQDDGAWRCLPPPKRDTKKYPRKTKRDDGSTYADPFYGPFNCFYESKCYGSYVDGEETGCQGKSCEICMGTGRDTRWYHNRNYYVFGILAGVRSSAFTPIAQPRGMPPDATAHVRDRNSWDHTPSWLGLHEILEFDWNQTTSHDGVIGLQPETKRGPFDLEDFATWMKRTGGKSAPDSFCGGVSGHVLTMAEARRWLAGKFVLGKERSCTASCSSQRHGVRVTWDETYRESARDFLAFVDETLIPLLGRPYAELIEIADDAKASGHPEEPNIRAEAMKIASSIRLVFGFDS